MSQIVTFQSWTINEGINICRQIQPICHSNGYHCGLIGGVLNNGESHNDLDIIIVKLAKEYNYNIKNLISKLKQFYNTDINLISNEERYSDNDRFIYRLIIGNKQIDLMVIK